MLLQFYQGHNHLLVMLLPFSLCVHDSVADTQTSVVRFSRRKSRRLHLQYINEKSTIESRAKLYT